MSLRHDANRFERHWKGQSRSIVLAVPTGRSEARCPGSRGDNAALPEGSSRGMPSFQSVWVAWSFPECGRCRTDRTAGNLAERRASARYGSVLLRYDRVAEETGVTELVKNVHTGRRTLRESPRGNHVPLTDHVAAGAVCSALGSEPQYLCRCSRFTCSLSGGPAGRGGNRRRPV